MKGKQISKLIPLSRLIPSIITLLALCMGVTAIRYAILGKMEMAATLILIAGFLDGIDGRVARLLNCSSDFGAQLDSLADMVNFGVSPAIIVYFWSLNTLPFGIGWGIVLFFIACAALRLARFNSQLDDEEAAIKSKNYFTGMPMPAAASMAILPMMLTFELVDHKFSPICIAIIMVTIGVMMVSRVPTFSAKKVEINRSLVPFIMLMIAAFFAFIILEPWVALPFVGAVYIITIPLSIISYYKNKNSI